MEKIPKVKTLELAETRDIQDFIPLLKEIDLGDRFLLSMLHWCGIGKRSSKLDFWQVFVARSRGETIGVCGLYRQPGMNPHVIWVGWFGVRPRFRRKGFGGRMLQKLKRLAANAGHNELWVYTSSGDSAAIAFYERHGFIRQGRASEVCPGRTMDLTDEVLMCRLSGVDDLI